MVRLLEEKDGVIKEMGRNAFQKRNEMEADREAALGMEKAYKDELCEKEKLIEELMQRLQTEREEMEKEIEERSTTIVLELEKEMRKKMDDDVSTLAAELSNLESQYAALEDRHTEALATLDKERAEQELAEADKEKVIEDMMSVYARRLEDVLKEGREVREEADGLRIDKVERDRKDAERDQRDAERDRKDAQIAKVEEIWLGELHELWVA